MKPVHLIKGAHSRTAARFICGGLLLGLAGLLAACLASAPQQTTSSPQVVITQWLALVQGTLIRTDGCLQLTTSFQTIDDTVTETYTLLWVPDLAVSEVNDLVLITSGMVSGRRRETILHIGQNIGLGGGTTDQVSLEIRRTAPAHCPGPYWIVASIVN